MRYHHAFDRGGRSVLLPMMLAAMLGAEPGEAGRIVGEVGAGARHSVALSADGGVLAWGDGRKGQLGNGDFSSSDWPASVVGPDGKGRLTGIVFVAAGMYHTLAVCDDGSVWAWGDNTFGQLGNGQLGLDAHQAVPVKVLGPHGQGHLRDVVAVAAGWDHSAALLKDGTVWTWGSRCQGQLGDGLRDSNQPSVHPVHVLAIDGKGMLGEAIALACGAHHTLVLRRDGGVLAWGGNHDGQLGNGRVGHASPRDGAAPEAVVGTDGSGMLGGVQAVAAGVYHSVALGNDGTVWTWGYNGTGQLGHGTRESTATSQDIVAAVPKPMVGGAKGGKLLTGIASVAAGYETTYAVDDAGRVWACGWNVYGGLGMGVGPNKVYNRGRVQAVVQIRDEAPVPIAGLKAIAAGDYHAVAVGAEGARMAWGHNGFGQLGDGGRQDREAAVSVAAFTPDSDRPVRPALVAKTPPMPKAGPRFAEPALGDDGVYSVYECGAKGDGIHLDQAALQAAIDAAHLAGGGVVLASQGVYRTGTLHLKSGVRLHLSEGAILLGSTNRDHYESRALIVADDARGIAITGRGTIDGNGQFCPSRGWRHFIIRMSNCADVIVEGVATNNSGAWTQHYVLCKNLTLRNVRLNSVRPGRNNDGLDFTGCQDVRIEGCVVASDDDCIVIKSNHASHVNRNIRAVDNVVYAFASGFKLGTETRGVFEDISCDGLHAFGGTTLGLYSVDGADLRRLRVSKVRAEASRCAFGVRLGARLRESYFEGDEPRTPGSLVDVELRDLDFQMAARPWRDVLLEYGVENAEMAHQLRVRPVETSFVSGLPEHPVRNVRIEAVRIVHRGDEPEEQAPAEVPERPAAYPAAGMFGTLPAWGLYLRHAEGVLLRDVRLTRIGPDPRPAIAKELADETLTVENLSIVEGEGRER